MSCHKITSVPLSEQHHFTGLHKIPGVEAVEVDAAGDGAAAIIRPRPEGFLPALRHGTIHDRRDELALHVVYAELHMHHARQIEPDRRRRIEGIGDVLVEGKYSRY